MMWRYCPTKKMQLAQHLDEELPQRLSHMRHIQ
jgi:hypothetical protein